MRKLLLGLAAVSIVSAGALVSTSAWAGYKMEVAENQWISLGMGLRFEAGTNEDPGDDWEKNFAVDSVRPYISGQVHEYIKFETNLEFNTNDDHNDIELLDGIVKLEFDDAINFWGGRMLPPSDRANLSGPYYINSWAFPVVAQRYPAIFQGRDNGVAAWGTVGDGMFKYQIGLFEGNDDADAPQLNIRLVLNLLDSEGTGYYNQSTYFGEKDILAIGGVVYYQEHGSGGRRDYTAWNIDVLFELKETAAGAPTINGAYYNYDNNGAGGPTSGEPACQADGLGDITNGPCGGGGATNPPADGESFFITGGWYLPGEIGIGAMKGKLEPHVRYQKFYNSNGPNQSRWDAGLNWYIMEQNAKFVVFYSHVKGDRSNAPLRNGVNVGFQVQF